MQAFETGFYGLEHVLALVAAGVGIRSRSGIRVFRSQHHALAVVLHELAQEGFAGSVGVEICGVDEIAAGFAERVVNLAGFFLGRAPAPVLAEGHGAQGGFGDAEAAVA